VAVVIVALVMEGTIATIEDMEEGMEEEVEVDPCQCGLSSL